MKLAQRPRLKNFANKTQNSTFFTFQMSWERKKETLLKKHGKKLRLCPTRGGRPCGKCAMVSWKNNFQTRPNLSLFIFSRVLLGFATEQSVLKFQAFGLGIFHTQENEKRQRASEDKTDCLSDQIYFSHAIITKERLFSLS